MECRDCGAPLEPGQAVWLTAGNLSADKPACKPCYEREIRLRLDPKVKWDKMPPPIQRWPGAAEREYNGGRWWD